MSLSPALVIDCPVLTSLLTMVAGRGLGCCRRSSPCPDLLTYHGRMAGVGLLQEVQSMTLSLALVLIVQS